MFHELLKILLLFAVARFVADMATRKYDNKEIHNLSTVETFLIVVYMLTLVSQRFPVLGEVSLCIRTLPNR